MNADEGNKNLDELISGVIGREEPKFDFDKWKKSHQSEIQSFESQTVDGRISCHALSINNWKAVLRTKVGRIAVAACLIIAILIILRPFSSSIDGATAAYAKMNEAVKNVPWMHIRYTSKILDPNGDVRTDNDQWDADIWYSFNSQILIQKYSFGQITYKDYSKQEVYNYNPDSKRIVLSALSGNKLPIETNSPWSWLERNIQGMMPYGGDVTRKTEKYNGKEVEVFEIISAPKSGMADVRGKIFVDKKTSLPIAEERTYINPEIGKPQRVEKGIFEYPQHGPADIYEVGLSRDIPIVNSLSLPPWEEIRRLYESYRRKPPERYIAIVTSELRIRGEPIESVDICYADTVHLREERHFLFRRGLIGVQWREQSDEIGNTYDSILKWAQSFKTHGKISISIHRNGCLYNSQRQEDGTWKTTKREFKDIELTSRDFWHLCPIMRIAWPQIMGYVDVIQDDYARQNNLIRLEAKGRQYYLNPDCDYICQIQVNEEGRKTEVKEFAQTREGKWYPKRVEKLTTTNTLYLETNPVFPEGIFDPNNLPKEGR